MRFLFLVVCLVFANSSSFAQESKWTHIEVLIQSRTVHKPFDYKFGEQFKTVLDIGIGTRWNYAFYPRFSLNMGLGMNYGIFKSTDEANESTLYVAYFKGQGIDYFNFQKIKQLTFETPVSIQYDFFQKNSNTLGLVMGGTPQILLQSKATGKSFDDTIEVVNSFSDGFNQKSSRINSLNDVLVNIGFSYSHKFRNGKAIIFETGYEYSFKGRSEGLLVKLGTRF
jgi:hypothetical protein